LWIDIPAYYGSSTLHKSSELHVAKATTFSCSVVHCIYYTTGRTGPPVAIQYNLMSSDGQTAQVVLCRHHNQIQLGRLAVPVKSALKLATYFLSQGFGLESHALSMLELPLTQKEFLQTTQFQSCQLHKIAYDYTYGFCVGTLQPRPQSSFLTTLNVVCSRHCNYCSNDFLAPFPHTCNCCRS